MIDILHPSLIFDPYLDHTDLKRIEILQGKRLNKIEIVVIPETGTDEAYQRHLKEGLATKYDCYADIIKWHLHPDEYFVLPDSRMKKKITGCSIGATSVIFKTNPSSPQSSIPEQELAFPIQTMDFFVDYITKMPNITLVTGDPSKPSKSRSLVHYRFAFYVTPIVILWHIEDDKKVE